jgi:hypothetical protein
MTTMKTIELLVRVSVDAPSDFDPKMLQLHVKNCALLDLTEGTASKDCHITEIEMLNARSL